MCAYGYGLHQAEGSGQGDRGADVDLARRRQNLPGPNLTVATVTDDFVSPLPGSSFRQDSRTFPSLSIAPNGALYVAWSNHTNGHAVVLVTHSSDGGLAWSVPAVAGNVSGRSAFFATVAADPGNNVNVGFLAMDDKPAGTAPGAGVVHYDAYFTRSTNGGASFRSRLEISAATSDPVAAPAPTACVRSSWATTSQAWPTPATSTSYGPTHETRRLAPP